MSSKQNINLSIAVIAMVAIFVISNYLVTFQINDWLTYGAFSFPLVFLVIDLVNRALGPSTARRVAWLALPFAAIISGYFAGIQIAIASAIAFIIGQLFDIKVFNKLRQNSWWIAPWCGSMLASVFDTICFFGIAFYDSNDPQWYKLAFQLGLGDLSIKWLMAILLLAPYRMLIPYLSFWQEGFNKS